jgi:hypothetical protein
MKDEATAEEERKKKEAKEVEDARARDAILSAETMPAETNLGKTWTGDVAPTLKAIIANAEVLAPGIALPTADSVAVDAVANLMRAALKTAYTTDAGKEVIGNFLLGRTFDSVLKGRELLGVFNGAAAMMRMKNNRTVGAGATAKLRTTDFGRSPPTNAELNEAARKRWAGQ